MQFGDPARPAEIDWGGGGAREPASSISAHMIAQRVAFERLAKLSQVRPGTQSFLPLLMWQLSAPLKLYFWKSASFFFFPFCHLFYFLKKYCICFLLWSTHIRVKCYTQNYYSFWGKSCKKKSTAALGAQS